MICRCIKDYKMSWAGCSIICDKGKDYRCEVGDGVYVFIDFQFLHHYNGFPVPDLAFNEHFLDVTEIREEKLDQILK